MSRHDGTDWTTVWLAAVIFGWLVVGLVALSWSERACAAEWGPYSARVERVVDGDTVDLAIDVYPGLVMSARVRVLGIDTPEARSRCATEALRVRERELAAEASAFARHWLGERPVQLTLAGTDSLGRTLGRLSVDGQDYAQAVRAAGLALPWPNDDGWCRP